MGMYLDVTVVYGVAWSGDSCPSECYPEWPEGHERAGEEVEEGEACGPEGRLVWGSYGMLGGSRVDRYLAVIEAPDGVDVSRYGARVPWHMSEEAVKWDGWIIDYLRSLGLNLTDVPEPGWLALASFG